MGVELTGFALGDANYPITPRVRLTNRSTTTIPAGAKVEFDYGTSAPGSMNDQSGFGLTVTRKGHTGPNIGGLKGDFQHASFTLPAGRTIPPGRTLELQVRYFLPIATPGNWRVTFGGRTYGLTADLAR